MTTPEGVAKMNEEMKKICDQWTVDLAEVQKKSKLQLYEEGNELKYMDKHSIDFVPSSNQEKRVFTSQLTREFTLRGMNPNVRATFERRVSLMKERLVGENSVKDILEKMDHCKANPEQLINLIMAIPCILHLEMRIGIKMIEMLILFGIANAKKNTLSWLHPNTRSHATYENSRATAFVERFEKIVNETI